MGSYARHFYVRECDEEIHLEKKKREGEEGSLGPAASQGEDSAGPDLLSPSQDDGFLQHCVGAWLFTQITKRGDIRKGRLEVRSLGITQVLPGCGCQSDPHFRHLQLAVAGHG